MLPNGLPDAGGTALPRDDEVQDFLESVSEVSRLVEGLKAGTISPQYVDGKIAAKAAKELPSSSGAAGGTAGRGSGARGPSPDVTRHPGGPDQGSGGGGGEDDGAKAAAEARRKEELMRKIEELRVSRERKLRARYKYQQYVEAAKQQQQQQQGGAAGGPAAAGMDAAAQYGTDYQKWDMWCPSDDEDELFNSLTPNTPEFRAMEKDINERHDRMIEQRQLAERQRVAGNDAFKRGQWSEALRCYQLGLESQRANMALHANAAMAALKIQCYVQAIEHCDKVLHIAEVFENCPQHALCVKARQRRAVAYRALQQYSRAVQDLEAAAEADPGDKEIQSQLARARRELDEYRKQKKVIKAMGKAQQAGAQEGAEAKAAGGEGTGAAGGSVEGLDLGKLRQVEQLAAILQQPTAPAPPATPQATDVAGSGAAAGATPRGPQLPTRSKANGAVPAASATGHAVASGRAEAVAAACRQLQALLEGDDFACVYMRECGGLEAAARQVTSPEACAPAVGLAPVLAVLNTCCHNDANMEQMPGLGVVKAAVPLLLAGPGAGAGGGGSDEQQSTAEAAAVLLCTLATNEVTRKAISAQLAAEGALGKLFGALDLLKPVTRAQVLTLLSNCMVDKPTKDACRPLLAAPATLAALAALVSPSAGPVVGEKAATLIGNLCGDAQARQSLAASSQLVLAIQDLLLRTAPGPAGAAAAAPAGTLQPVDVQPACTAAATALYNLLLEPAGQDAVLSDPEHLRRLLGLLGAAGVRADGGAGRWPEAMPLLVRLAGAVARAAKHARVPAVLLDLGACAVLVRLVGEMLDVEEARPAAAAAVKGGKSSTGGSAPAEGSSLEVQVVDAGVRALTQMTAAGADDAACRRAVDATVEAGGVPALLRVLRVLPAGHSALGNAALCVGQVAKYADLLPTLRGLDAVAPLVKVAYDGKGDTASKNAAIALARMAHDPAMLERLRELHGIEIIYQYVKP